MSPTPDRLSQSVTRLERVEDTIGPGDLIRVELHDSLHRFGVLLRWLEVDGCEIVRYEPGANVAWVRGPDDVLDGVAMRWNLEGWVELSAGRG